MEKAYIAIDESCLNIINEVRSHFSNYLTTNLWHDKDPRLCLTLPAMSHLLLRRAPVLAIVRSPVDVASSLYARNGIPFEHGLLLWYLYNYNLAQNLTSTDFILSFDSLHGAYLNPEVPTLYHKLSLFFDFHNIPFVSHHTFSNILTKRLDPALFRAETFNFNQSILPQLLDEITRLYTPDHDITSFIECFYSTSSIVLSRLSMSPFPLTPSESISRRDTENCRNTLSSIYSSRTWRVARLLRSLAHFAR